jgi:hypothetical protein
MLFCTHKEFRERKIYLCHYVNSGYHSNELSAGNMLHEPNVCRTFISVYRVYAVSIDNNVTCSVTMAGFIGHFLQLLTTLHGSLSHTDECPQSRCWVAASKDGCSSASWLTSLQGGDHLTSTS